MATQPKAEALPPINLITSQLHTLQTPDLAMPILIERMSA
jgi:hypothetical protein